MIPRPGKVWHSKAPTQNRHNRFWPHTVSSIQPLPTKPWKGAGLFMRFRYLRKKMGGNIRNSKSITLSIIVGLKTVKLTHG